MPMDSLLESALNAAALRPEQGTVAEAFQAQDVECAEIAPQ